MFTNHGTFTDSNGIAATALPVSKPGEFKGKIWVVLAAGGVDWKNYSIHANLYHAYQMFRGNGSIHANLYHAYQMFRGNGIPKENIIVMHYDDIAYNTQNPSQGKVFNKFNGSDVYHEVPKHYTGEYVTPDNFLDILKGDEAFSQNGKWPVVNSGPDDHIFVYFIDHGSHGSVFNSNLPNDIDVYAVTSSAPLQDSWQAFCDHKDTAR
ncbi:unnamed protein product [Medioppia subpectinata]|uniref:Legumain n=1 Tax=Medioppia subpectinata TaxID=1979941 RepID=A0A7R9Q7C0_9ACAR|nr:unnamed protein product [Medioppia subpectinata]CAG2115577.1 unnamed protein product [Medioppia subpectinata]